MAYQEGQQEAAVQRGAFLRQRRLSLGLGVVTVAKTGARHPTNIRNLENGLILDPPISTLTTIARGYQMPMMEVLGLFGIELDLNTHDDTSAPEPK